MTTKPEPSQLITLEQLNGIETGTKVRFLGCVHSYDGASACLTLRTHFPATERRSLTAVVNVRNVLDSTKHELLEVGAWVNIIAYVRTEEAWKGSKRDRYTTFLEAVMIWSAGAIELDKYNAAIDGLQQTSSVIQAEDNSDIKS